MLGEELSFMYVLYYNDGYHYEHKILGFNSIKINPQISYEENLIEKEKEIKKDLKNFLHFNQEEISKNYLPIKISAIEIQKKKIINLEKILEMNCLANINMINLKAFYKYEKNI